MKKQKINATALAVVERAVVVKLARHEEFAVWAFEILVENGKIHDGNHLQFRERDTLGLKLLLWRKLLAQNLIKLMGEEAAVSRSKEILK